MALPDVAYFGQKDAQQLVVIRRLVADLNLPVRDRRRCPTVRERDGLAMSSRNARLAPAERARALALPERAASRRASAPATASARPTALLDAARGAMLAARGRARVPRARRSRDARAAARSSRARRCWPGRARRRDAPDRQRDPEPAAPPSTQRPTPSNAPGKAIAHAARDAQVEDPPGDGHRLRPALRRLDHDRPGPARGGRHPRARAGARASTSTTARASRPTRSPASAARARCASTAPPRAWCTAATRSSSSPTPPTTTAEMEHYEPRVVHVEAQHQSHHHHRRRGGDPAHAERASTASERKPRMSSQPTVQSPDRPRPRCR